MKLRALGVGSACVTVLVVACALAAPAGTTGCTTHQCDTPPLLPGPPGSDFHTFAGDLVLWESSPAEGTWIPFPHEQTYSFALPGYFVPLNPPQAWISTGAALGDPTSGATTVPAAGQLTEIATFDTIFPDGGPPFQIFNVTNGTCADYYLSVSVLGWFPPPSSDAGTD